MSIKNGFEVLNGTCVSHSSHQGPGIIMEEGVERLERERGRSERSELEHNAKEAEISGHNRAVACPSW